MDEDWDCPDLANGSLGRTGYRGELDRGVANLADGAVGPRLRGMIVLAFRLMQGWNEKRAGDKQKD